MCVCVCIGGRGVRAGGVAADGELRGLGAARRRPFASNYKVVFAEKSSKFNLFNVATNTRDQRAQRSSVKIEFMHGKIQHCNTLNVKNKLKNRENA